MQTHCSTFEETEENKLEYTPVFNSWQKSIETHIEKELQNAESLKGTGHFTTMEAFLESLGTRSNIEEEIMEEVGFCCRF